MVLRTFSGVLVVEEGSVVLELVVLLVVKEVSLEEELVVLLEESLEVALSSPKLTRQELMMRVRSNKLDKVRAFFIISTSVDTKYYITLPFP